MKKAKSILGLTVCAALAASALPMNIIADAATGDEVLYGTMKIPYAEFYAAELEGASNVNVLDAVSSATDRKSLMTGAGQMFEGAWSEAVTDAGVNGAGNEIKAKIYGVVYPVAITKADLDALGENNYGFAELTAQPVSYKQATVSGGNVTFSKVIDSAPETVEGSAKLSTSTPWGDYLLNVTGKPSGIIYGIIIDTADGDKYALRHEQNIWRGGEFSWSSGIKTVEAHGNYLEYENFVTLMGKTVTDVQFITADGYVTVDVGNVYIPVKFDGGVSVANTAVSAGKADIVKDGVPADYKADYSVEGLEAQFDGDSFTFENASAGSYTLTVKDANGKYAELSASFQLTTADMPAVYDDEKGALTTAEGFTEEDLNNFIKNISSVSVEGKAYSASGRGATKIVGTDGVIIDSAAPFADNKDSYEIEVTATGFENKLSFTYSKFVYGTMNIPYAEFYAAELKEAPNDSCLDAVSSATVTKTTKNGKGELFEGTYNNAGEEGSDTVGKIYGVTYPVAVTRSAAAEIGEQYSFAASDDKPAAYKIVTVKDGAVTFAEVTDSEPESIEISPKVETDTKRGDYMLTVKEASDLGVIYGVIIKTADGNSYALRHEQNIWRNELSWSVGYLTDDGKGNPLEYQSFLPTDGATVTEIVYITENGVVSAKTDTYLPKKFYKYKETPVSVEDAEATAGKTAITVTEKPEDYDAVYSVEGLDCGFSDSAVFFTDAQPGEYTLVMSDRNGVYESAKATFALTTADMPAAYDKESVSLTTAEGFTDEQLAAYIRNITAVSVNGTEYSASGKRATVIIKADGTLDTEASPFAEGDSFEVAVKSAGYTTELTFTYSTKPEDEDKPADEDKPTDTEPTKDEDEPKPADTEPTEDEDEPKPADTQPTDDETEPKDGDTTADESRKGDVNGDGKVNVTDVSRIAAYVKSVKKLDDDEMKCADINGDGKVNVSDISLLAAYVKGIKPLG